MKPAHPVRNGSNRFRSKTITRANAALNVIHPISRTKSHEESTQPPQCLGQVRRRHDRSCIVEPCAHGKSDGAKGLRFFWCAQGLRPNQAPLADGTGCKQVHWLWALCGGLQEREPCPGCSALFPH